MTMAGFDDSIASLLARFGVAVLELVCQLISHESQRIQLQFVLKSVESAVANLGIVGCCGHLF